LVVVILFVVLTSKCHLVEVSVLHTFFAKVGTLMKRILSILSAVMMILGFSLLFYPTLSSWIRDMLQANIAQEYEQSVEMLCLEEIDKHLSRAKVHNADLRAIGEMGALLLGEMAVLPEDYYQILNIDGVMARLEIPAIRLDLPVLHGTSSHTMENGVGHLEGTAFPIGGYGNHAALSTHSGMAGNRLFSDLHMLEVGDLFFISVLGERLAYQVYSKTVILPHEVTFLRTVPEADIVTLITCTPIAINTHRLLVRGYRVQYPLVLEEIFDEVIEILMINRHLNVWGGVIMAVFAVALIMVLRKVSRNLRSGNPSSFKKVVRIPCL